MGQQVRILHVEDDEEYADLFALMLKRTAAKRGDEAPSVEAAASVPHALSLLASNSYDCLVCDYQLGGDTGFALLRRVKDSYTSLPFIFLTGQGDETVAREAFIQGCNDYFCKDHELGSYERIYNAILSQIALATASQEQERRTKKHLEELEYLASTAIELLGVALDDDLFRTIKRHLDELCGDSILVVLQYDEEGLFHIMHTCLPPDLPDAFASLGKISSPMGFHNTYVEQLKRGAFVTFPPDWTGITCSDKARSNSKRLVEALGVVQAHALGIQVKDHLKGAVMALELRGRPFRSKHLLEAYLNQATVAMEKRAIERSMLEKERLYHTHITKTPEIIFITDGEGRCKDANPAAISWSGYDIETLRTLQITELIDKKARNCAEKGFSFMHKGGRLGAEYPFRLKDGSLRWLLVDWVRVDDDTNVAFCKDVTETKDAIMRLSRLNIVLATLRELSLAAGFAHNEKEYATKALDVLTRHGAYHSGWIVLTDREGATSWAIEKKVPQPTAFLDLMKKNAPMPCYVEAYTEKGATVVNNCTSAMCVQCPFYDTYPKHISLTRCLSHEDQVYGVLSLQLSDTYGAMADEQELFEELAKDIGIALTSFRHEIQKMALEAGLVRQREELAQFAHLIAHEIRSDLSVIQAYAQTSELPETTRLEKISRKTDEIARFISKSLALAEEGTVAGEGEPVDLSPMLSALAEDFKEKGLTLTYGSLPCVLADGQKLREVFMNTLSNAVEHGGADCIHVVSDMVLNGVRVRIQDNGKGFDPSLLPHAFVWGHTTKKGHQGIGLPLVKRIIQAHGGVVAAYNNPTGQGAIVSFRLPRHAVLNPP